MCELLGISSAVRIPANDYLRVFASHSVGHPNGWGLADFYGNSVSLEKEPVSARESRYLKERLYHGILTDCMIAHIRQATRGAMSFENCHPFVMRDNFDRAWTLAHNGTIFDCEALNQYVHTQEGQTDSERILCHIIAKVNEKQSELNRSLTVEERFSLMDEIIWEIAPHNKVNLLIYDGELFYVHTNYANSLYYQQVEGGFVFATVPLNDGNWEPVPFMELLAYHQGKERFRGKTHPFEYKENPDDLKYIYIDYSSL